MIFCDIRKLVRLSLVSPLMPRHIIATPLIGSNRGSYGNLFVKWLQYICLYCNGLNMLQYVWFVIAINHFRIVLQLVGIIAMALWSCISIDFHCNYFVLLKLYSIWLCLLVTIAVVILGCNNFIVVAIASWLLQQELLMDARACYYCHGFMGFQ